MPLSRGWRSSETDLRKSLTSLQKYWRSLSCDVWISAAKGSFTEWPVNFFLPHATIFVGWLCVRVGCLEPPVLLVFSNNRKNSISDDREIKHRIVAYLEIWVKGHSRWLEMAHFIRSHTSSYLSFVVTMAISCAVFEIERDIVRKTPIFRTPLHDSLEILLIFARNFNTNCPSLWAIRRCRNISEKLKSLCRRQQCNRQTTDGQTDGSAISRNVT